MRKMIVLILHNQSHFEEMLAAWHVAGAPAVTIIDGTGTRGAREQTARTDLPLLPSIRDLLQSDDAPRKIVIAIVPEEAVEPIVRATETIVGDLMEPGNGILAVLPVERVVGLRLGP